MAKSPYEFSPDIVGAIPLDDRPRLLWRAFYRVFRSMHTNEVMTGLDTKFAGDQVFVHPPFKKWWDYCSHDRTDRLACPQIIRHHFFKQTGKLYIFYPELYR